MTPIEPDPVKKAEELSNTGGAASAAPPTDEKKRGGWPKGKPRGPRKAGAQPQPQPVIEPTESDKIACALLFNTLWRIVIPWTKRRELTADESRQAGEALAPLVAKYLPMIGDWQIELNAAIVLLGIWAATAPPEKPAIKAIEAIAEPPKPKAKNG